jgi:hypothetical protein
MEDTNNIKNHQYPKAAIEESTTVSINADVLPVGTRYTGDALGRVIQHVWAVGGATERAGLCADRISVGRQAGAGAVPRCTCSGQAGVVWIWLVQKGGGCNPRLQLPK